jgi:hypothetical protein
MPKNAVYLVEDLHTAYWPKFGGGMDRPESFINIAKGLVDKLNADHAMGAIEPDAFTRDTFSVAFYDSIVVFEKGQVWRKEPTVTGGKKTRLF